MFTVKTTIPFDATAYDQEWKHSMVPRSFKLTAEFWTKGLDEHGNPPGMNRITDLQEWVQNKLHDKHLNDVLITTPTCASIAQFVYYTLKPTYKDLHSISVETDNTSISYAEDQ